MVSRRIPTAEPQANQLPIQTISPQKRWRAYFRALRPRQWTKNLVVFAAPLFAFSISLPTILSALLACVLFCAISSSFYLWNDIADVEADRQHPVKCQRPIASGLVKIPVAIGLAIMLLLGALLIAASQSFGLVFVLSGYAILQLAYNWRLKQTVILDIFAIAAGFVFRAYAGAVATQVSLSPWFVLCTAMLALFLAIEKRKAELRWAQIRNAQPRKVLKRYSSALLHRMENIATTGAVVTYALWSAGPKLQGASTSWMLITVPFVLHGIFRYQLISDPQEIANQSASAEPAGRSERPEDVLLHDRPILFTVVGWIVSCFLVLWCKHQGIIA
jgi:decaprenyl-phosphate phosphoribosyltransferase